MGFLIPVFVQILWQIEAIISRQMIMYQLALPVCKVAMQTEKNKPDECTGGLLRIIDIDNR